MAYAKSKSAYPAWVHAFVPTLVKLAKHSINEDVELRYPTEIMAKKARFEIYGFINVMLASKSAAEQEEGKLAKSWSILLRNDEETGETILRFVQKNDTQLTGAIFAVIQDLEEKIAAVGGKVIPPPTVMNRPAIPTLAEKLALQEGKKEEFLSTEDIYGTGEG